MHICMSSHSITVSAVNIADYLLHHGIVTYIGSDSSMETVPFYKRLQRGKYNEGVNVDVLTKHLDITSVGFAVILL